MKNRYLYKFRLHDAGGEYADEYSTGGLCIEFADGASERGGE